MKRLCWKLINKKAKRAIKLLLITCSVAVLIIIVFYGFGDKRLQLMRERRDISDLLNPVLLPEKGFNCDQRKYLVYRCHGSCGGLGDRQKAIVSAFLLATLTNRTFVIDMTYPCGIDSFLEPNRYDWRICKHYALDIPKADDTSFHMIDNRTLYERMLMDTELESAWTTKKVTLALNWYAIDAVRHHVMKTNMTSMDWIKSARNEHVVHKILKILFRPKKAVVKKIDTFMREHVGNRTLVCGHIRIGQNPTLPNDVSFDTIRGHPNISKLMSFLSKYKDHKQFAVYVATDSNEVRQFSARRFDNFVSLNRTIVHIDRLELTISKSLGCVGFYNAIIEQYVLTRCDVLLLTMSNFGVIAALIRGQSEGIYIYETKNHTISHISLWNIFNFYYFD